MTEAEEELLTVADVAQLLEIEPVTWRAYVSRGRAPAADGHLGATPYWRRETVDRWAEARPRAGRR